MQPHDDPLYRDPKIQHVMERRRFLKTIGGAVGVAALLGADSLRQVEAVVGNTVGLTPRQVAQEESFWTVSKVTSRTIRFRKESSTSSFHP